MNNNDRQILIERFGAKAPNHEIIGCESFEVKKEHLIDTLHFLKNEASSQFEMLFDLSAIDECERGGGLSVFYYLLSVKNKAFISIRTHIANDTIEVPTVVGLWPNANWYEREVYDMFGIKFTDHPDLRRILTFDFWKGHPLRKSYPCRATLMDEPFDLEGPDFDDVMKSYDIQGKQDDGSMVLNIGPNHPGTDGVIRLKVKMKGEYIEDLDQEIGFHHRGAEKIAERHTFHNYIPYTDRIDYLGGVAGELPYLLGLEAMTGIKVPERAKTMRIMLCELFRISSHLVWFGSITHNLGGMAPAFYAFTEREKIFDVIELICGGRMHPAFFRIGGVSQDLPDGWEEKVEHACQGIEQLVPDLEKLMTNSMIFKVRTQNIAVYSQSMALDWGLTGPNLRATGINFDMRKDFPYMGYEDYDFDVPVGQDGDAYTRTVLRVQEVVESLKIIRQAAARMPEGPILADNAPNFGFPRKQNALRDIETLIHSFVDTGRGFNFPVAETFYATETAKGVTSYHTISNGTGCPYRVRIRTPSFTHFQSVKAVSKGDLLSNIICLIGSIDYVLADIDR
ncbi:NADH dehydrogenase (quinone) subunit D [Photobacterium angustum]|uniref:NADH dehydrogenase (quinone) subunit D n=1 Tax=Photobacterium angustum TaxID=661 RepID=UPI0005E4164D|nr:NADH dehydrogenase (quinone) subunit D [Photobacterium angustum]KJG33296.1 NADH dehydrogenase [Photobacterium angustum]PSW89614.1 NADH dehydrogenase (quinone) subunit D [Photobacterium angustum]